MKIFILLHIFILILYADISIKEAWNIIEHKSNAISASNKQLLKTKLEQSSAKSMYLPNISIIGNYTHLNKEIDIGTDKVSSLLSSLHIPVQLPSSIDLSKKDVFLADLNLLWPLYTGGKIDAMQDIYASNVDEAKALVQMQKDTSFLKLIKYYYGVVVANSLYKTTKEAKNALKIHLDYAKSLYKQGQIAKVELLDAEVKLDSLKIKKIKAKHKLKIARSAFYSMIKEVQKPSSPLFIAKNIKDENYYKNKTKSNYAPLGIFDANEKKSLSLLKIKKSYWYPEIMAYANYNLYKDDSPLMKSAPKWMVGAIIKFDILQNKDRNKDIEASKLLNKKIKNLKAQALEDLKILVEKTYNEMILYKNEYISLNSSIKMASENFKLRELSFQEGLSTSVEVVDAQMFISSIKTKRADALYNYVQKISQLAVLSGNRELFFNIEKISKDVK